MNWKNFTLSFTGFLLCLFFIFYYSFFKEEYYIDGDEIKNVCDAWRVFVVDDIRDVTAPLTLAMIAPFIVMSVRKKSRSRFLWLMTMVLLLSWWWRFFGRLWFCL
ncbi:YjeO family protein [Erwinia sp. V71]|uniref:YjeO family protein n=1 Tax=Erwinia sp. V71 TaxID=3369424 RepID=UPI003F5FF0E9